MDNSFSIVFHNWLRWLHNGLQFNLEDHRGYMVDKVQQMNFSKPLKALFILRSQKINSKEIMMIMPTELNLIRHLNLEIIDVTKFVHQFTKLYVKFYRFP